VCCFLIWLGLFDLLAVFHRGWSVLESRGKWHPNGKSEEGVARKGRNHQGLKNSIAFNGERKVQKGEGVWLVKAKPEDHEWQEEFNSNEREALEKQIGKMKCTKTSFHIQNWTMWLNMYYCILGWFVSFNSTYFPFTFPPSFFFRKNKQANTSRGKKNSSWTLKKKNRTWRKISNFSLWTSLVIEYARSGLRTGEGN